MNGGPSINHLVNTDGNVVYVDNLPISTPNATGQNLKSTLMGRFEIYKKFVEENAKREIKLQSTDIFPIMKYDKISKMVSL